jgi:serine/threonine protein kinase
MPALNNCRAGVALVIGVGEYLRAERVEPLRFATRDAEALADALADPNLCSFPRDQVTLLTNGEARRDAVVQRLSRWLPEQACGAELVVIYFAGHGMVQTVGRREEGFLLPYDADPEDVVTRGVAMSDLARWIDGLDAQAVVVCLDCCHAGKVLGQRDPATTLTARDLELKPAVLQGMAGRGRYLIASCDEGQKSFECAELGHGLFTFHLLQGIAGAADRDGDGRVGLAELFNYVATAVSRDARQRFGREQKPWTSATWAEETYISWPHARTPVPEPDPLERLWREQGAAAAVQAIEQTLPDAGEEPLQRALRLLGRMKEATGIPTIFRCLAHASEAVRKEARSALHALNWETVVGAVEGLARRGDPAGMAAVLDGLNAFEAHPRVVGLLDRLVVVLKGELRNRAILLLERKRLGLGLERVAALFRDIRSPYQIEKVLGQGLFTESYLARAEGTGLEVVVRVLRPEFVSQPHVRARFLDLSNQSVPLVHEKLALTREARAFPDQNIYFAVRDYIAGVTLQRVLEAGKRFEPIKVVRLVREVAEALTPLHRQGACHGGIKPSNIFLCEGDRVVLGDPCLPVQGIGVALDRLAYDYRYAPPETFLGGEAWGPRSDFYALGCVAYELLCGEPPFVSDNFHELAARHITGSIPPPGQRGSRLGEKGDAAVLKLLARSAAERYGTLAEVLQTFAFLEDALKRPAAGGASVPGALPPALLRDASVMNYQGGQSLLNFDRTGPGLSRLTVNVETGEPAASPRIRPQVPGYEILAELGRGGMGVVYKARQVSLNRLVALKMILAAEYAGMDELVRFRKEAEAVAGLQHPNIVQIHDIGEQNGLPFFCLEYVDGGGLADKLRGAPLAPREAARLVATLAEAVHYAHQRGILHRDLKPANILLTSEGLPKITDFGLAKRLDHSSGQTRSGAIVGTPSYMAPEQAQGRSKMAGPTADVYALGAMLYECLTGRPPFKAETALDTLLQVLNQEPMAPRRLQPKVPRDLDTICLKCLQKNPQKRYSSAADLAADLERFLEGQPIAMRPPSLLQRLARFFSFGRSGKPPRGDRAPDP